MNKNKKLKIGVSPVLPMVGLYNNRYSGFEVELFKKIAKDLGWKYSFVKKPFLKLIPLVKESKLDIAFAAISVNEKREKQIDFSHHTMDTGLAILIPKKSQKSLFSSFHHILKHDILPTFSILIGFILFSAHLIWFIEKGAPTFHDTYYPGIIDAIWWAVVTVAAVGYGDIVPLTIAGKIISTFIILIGLGIFGFYIARISSLLTIREIESDISSHHDLQAKVVATVKGTASVEVLHDIGAIIVEVDSIEDAYNLLYKRDVQAIVFDAPVLMRYASNEGKNDVRVIGKIFEPQSYAFVLPTKSPLKEDINRAILRLKDSGEYTKLYESWFGRDPDRL